MRTMDKKKPNIKDAALAVTRWVGSPISLALHTVFFTGIFVLGFSGIADPAFLFAITTNILSIEAIYLAIFIQMTINYQAQALEEVQEDVEGIQEDVGEIQEDVEEMQEDVGEIQTDIDEVQKDVDELQEDVEEMSEEEKSAATEEELRKNEQRETLENIEADLEKLLADIAHLKQTRKPGDAKPLF